MFFKLIVIILYRHLPALFGTIDARFAISSMRQPAGFLCMAT